MCIEASQYTPLMKQIEKCKTLKNIVLFEAVTEEHRKLAEEKDLRVYSFSDIIEEGKRVGK